MRTLSSSGRRDSRNTARQTRHRFPAGLTKVSICPTPPVPQRQRSGNVGVKTPVTTAARVGGHCRALDPVLLEESRT